MNGKRGDCYEAASRFVQDNPWMTLVHGTCTGQGPIAGVTIGHAWAEDGDLVFDVSNGHNIMLRKEEYYEIGKCRDLVKYTTEEMFSMLVKHHNYGPWHHTTAKHYERKPRKHKNPLTFNIPADTRGMDCREKTTNQHHENPNRPQHSHCRAIAGYH